MYIHGDNSQHVLNCHLPVVANYLFTSETYIYV